MFVESFSTIVFLKLIPVSEEGRMLKYRPSLFWGDEQDAISKSNIAGRTQFLTNRFYADHLKINING